MDIRHLAVLLGVSTFISMVALIRYAIHYAAKVFAKEFAEEFDKKKQVWDRDEDLRKVRS